MKSLNLDKIQEFNLVDRIPTNINMKLVVTLLCAIFMANGITAQGGFPPQFLSVSTKTTTFSFLPPSSHFYVKISSMGQNDVVNSKIKIQLWLQLSPRRSEKKSNKKTKDELEEREKKANTLTDSRKPKIKILLKRKGEIVHLCDFFLFFTSASMIYGKYAAPSQYISWECREFR